MAEEDNKSRQGANDFGPKFEGLSGLETSLAELQRVKSLLQRRASDLRQARSELEKRIANIRSGQRALNVFGTGISVGAGLAGFITAGPGGGFALSAAGNLLFVGIDETIEQSLKVLTKALAESHAQERLLQENPLLQQQFQDRLTSLHAGRRLLLTSRQSLEERAKINTAFQQRLDELIQDVESFISSELPREIPLLDKVDAEFSSQGDVTAASLSGEISKLDPTKRTLEEALAAVKAREKVLLAEKEDAQTLEFATARAAAILDAAMGSQVRKPIEALALALANSEAIGVAVSAQREIVDSLEGQLELLDAQSAQLERHPILSQKFSEELGALQRSRDTLLQLRPEQEAEIQAAFQRRLNELATRVLQVSASSDQNAIPLTPFADGGVVGGANGLQATLSGAASVLGKVGDPRAAAAAQGIGAAAGIFGALGGAGGGQTGSGLGGSLLGSFGVLGGSLFGTDKNGAPRTLESLLEERVPFFSEFLDVQESLNESFFGQEEAHQEALTEEQELQNKTRSQWMEFSSSAISKSMGAAQNIASALMQSGSKKMFAVGKSIAVAQAVLDTVQGAIGAFAAFSWIPFVGPALGAAAAAEAIKMGKQRIKQIQGQQFGTSANVSPGDTPSFPTAEDVKKLQGGTPTLGGARSDAQTLSITIASDRRVLPEEWVRDHLIPGINETIRDGATLNISFD